MRDLFDFNQKKDFYAVLGNPVSHSLSPYIHRQFALQCRQTLQYETIQVDPGGFVQAVGNFVAGGGKGFNITVPFKRDAWELCDERSERSQIAGAVNSILVGKNDKLSGDNTDGVGLIQDLTGNLGVTLKHKRILILGAGGAVRGILQPLLAQNPHLVWVANRTPSKAQSLAQEFTVFGEIIGSSYGNFEGENFDLIINATSASLHQALPGLAEQVIHPAAVCYDMMYGANATLFMLWASRCGAATVHDGLGMLVEQAAEAFARWRGVRPETGSVLNDLRQHLTQKAKIR